ncbi:MAG TPA: nickel-type superoxide dismutase maturation protease [Acidimicrobiales bacterium]|nr:nickel-type superoxide dismutase maturation protease [Acidimicrobiales bacterium]
MRQLVVTTAVGVAGSATLGASALGVTAFVGVRRWTRRVVVEGRSMWPTFEPGDRLLVVRLPRPLRVRAGDVVAVADPRAPARLLVKRVAVASPGQVTVTGDNASESTDSREFGPVARSQVWGLVRYRYAPSERSGRIRRAGAARGDPAG